MGHYRVNDHPYHASEQGSRDGDGRPGTEADAGR